MRVHSVDFKRSLRAGAASAGESSSAVDLRRLDAEVREGAVSKAANERNEAIL